MSVKSYDVLIVGAGITGLSLALLLAKESDLSVGLLDATQPKPKWLSDETAPRVSAINAAAMGLFHRLDIWDTLKSKRVSPYTHMSVWDAASIGFVGFDCADVHKPVLGHIIENPLMQETLLSAIAAQPNITTHWPVQCTALEMQGAARVITTAQGDSFKAQLVIGADGARSWVRRAADIACDESPYHQTAIVTSIKTAKPHQQTARQAFLETGPLALLPLADSHAHSIVWSCEIEKANRLMAMDDTEFKLTLNRAFDFELGPVLAIEKRYAFPLIMRHVQQYVKPRLALIGDAAHTIHPLAGQGLNIALMDVVCLADLLLKACQKNKPIAAERLLKKYERIRRAENDITVKAMGGFKALFANTNTSVVLARSQGLRLVNKLAFIKKVFIKHAMGLS